MSILIGIAIGLCLGLTGSGGSIVAVPMLIIFLGFEPTQAIGTSLGVVAASTLFGVVRQIGKCNIAWRAALLFAALGSLFTPLGFHLASSIDPNLIILGFSILVCIVAFLMWGKSTRHSSIHKCSSASDHSKLLPPDQGRTKSLHLSLPSALSIPGSAAFTGILSGFFGVGGGFMIVPILRLVMDIPIQKAIATSLLIISVISSAGFMNYMLASDTNVNSLLAQIALGGCAGMALGLALISRLASSFIEKLFVILMLALSAIMLIDQFIV